MIKHLFSSRDSNLCNKCGKGNSNSIHLHPSIPLMFNWLFNEKFAYFKRKVNLHLRKKCERCGVDTRTTKITKHHLKDMNGERTGETQRLCRPCHDIAEEEYITLGIVKLTPPQEYR